MDIRPFADTLKKYLHTSGLTQKQLARAIGLHPKVLSRKLNGSANAYLNRAEIQSIITKLADWHVITTQEEALCLLDLAGVEPAIFYTDDWQTPLLSTLAKTPAQPALSQDTRSPRSTLQHNLPAPRTRLIGRDWAVERLQSLLSQDDVRLVTLVGAGGSGKTRLALHVANELVGKFAQGVWLVTLGGVSDPALVPISITQALNIQSSPGLSPLQGLIAHLQDKQLLLVLDNFEQVGEAAIAVDEMLAGAPGLKALVTSRTVLHLDGEHLLSIPPLDIPDLSMVRGKARISQFEAIQLFIERAQAVMPDFALTDENAAVIAQICARVDGLPLALELAAARVKMLSPEQLLERLSKARLPLLTGGAKNLPDRQKTLHNTITWSYDLLTSTEQVWFRRLGVFYSGWSLEAAEALVHSTATGLGNTSDDVSPLAMLEQLADNSLLIRLSASNSQAQYTMLETLREYALEQLSKQKECERLRDWHACYYLMKAEAAEIGLRGPQQLAWLARLAADRDNFRAALAWSLQRAKDGARIGTFPSLQQQPAVESKEVASNGMVPAQELCDTALPAIELCLRLAAAMRFYWEWQGHLTEGRHWLRAALAVPLQDDAAATTLAARAKALSEAARLVCLQNDQASAVKLAEESIALWRQLNDPGGLAAALIHRGWAAHAMGEYETAKSVYQEGMRYISQASDPWLYAQLLVYMAAASGFTSELEQMNAYYMQSKELFEQLGDKCAVADLTKDWGGLLIIAGNHTEAIDLLLKSIKLCYELNHIQFIATGLGSLSFALGLREEPDPAQASIASAQIGGAAERLMDTIGLTPWTRANPVVMMIRQRIRLMVDDQAWKASWAAGRALTIEQAIDLAFRLGGKEM